VAALKRLVLAREAELAAAQVQLIQAKARETSTEAMILHLRLAVEKLRTADLVRERGALPCSYSLKTQFCIRLQTPQTNEIRMQSPPWS
jgi:hypothetical protein